MEKMNITPGSNEKEIEEEQIAIPPVAQRWGKRNWQMWVGVFFSLGFFVLALWNVDLKLTVESLSRVNFLLLGLALVSTILSALLKAIRWRLLLSVRNEPALGRVFSVLYIGQMVNAFLPSRLGEIARAYLIGESEADSKVYVLGTIVVEKVIDLLFLLISLLFLVLQMPLPEWLAGPARGSAIAMLILIPILLILAWQREFIIKVVERISHIFPLTWRKWVMQQAKFGLTSLDVVRHPRLLVSLLFWSLIIWVLSALTNYFVFIAMGIALPLWSSLLLLVVLQIGSAVPSTPGRIGVFQYLTILTLSIFAIDKNIALGVSVLLYLVIYIPIALIGGYCLWREKVTWKKLDEAVATLKRLRSRMR
jgi:hypothetical protein